MPTPPEASRRLRSHIRRWRFNAPVILIALITFTATSAAGGSTTSQIPATIASNCSVDVTQAINSWIATVPDNSTLSFALNGCYRVEGTITLTNRNGLDIEGNGATFETTTVGDSQRAHWRIVGGSNLVFRNLKIRGSKPPGTGFVSTLQHQPGFDLDGVTNVEIDRADVSDVYGDCVYVGIGWYGTVKAWSSNVRVHNSTCLRSGRMGVAVTAGQNVLVETSTFDQTGLSTFDVEPNGSGFGANGVTFTNNKIGSLYDYVFVATGSGPVDNVTVSGNTVTGHALHIGVLSSDLRHSNIRIIGNTSDTGYYDANGAVMTFTSVDGLTVTGNTAPLTGPNMALATVSESCSVNVSGNSFSGGVTELRLAPWICTSTSAPTITSFTPTTGSTGTSVTITGTNFDGATAVAFAGVTATFRVDSNAQISSVIPSGATSGALTVTTPAGTVTSSTSFPLSVPPPSTKEVTATVTSFSPTSGVAGTIVAITGTFFTGVTAVAFNGATATFTVVSDTQISAIVPTGAKSGMITVTTPAGTVMCDRRFRVSGH